MCQNFTFRQNHSTGFIERRLDYMYISCITCSDHPSVLLSNDNCGCGLWKFNSSLVHDKANVEKMKKFITKINTSNEFIGDAQTKWEFLKYEFRKFTIDYSKNSC